MAVNNRDTVVAQLAEWLFPAPEDPSSNPVIGNFSKQSITADCEEEKTKEKISFPNKNQQFTYSNQSKIILISLIRFLDRLKLFKIFN